MFSWQLRFSPAVMSRHKYVTKNRVHGTRDASFAVNSVFFQTFSTSGDMKIMSPILFSENVTAITTTFTWIIHTSSAIIRPFFPQSLRHFQHTFAYSSMFSALLSSSESLTLFFCVLRKQRHFVSMYFMKAFYIRTDRELYMYRFIKGVQEVNTWKTFSWYIWGYNERNIFNYEHN
jgi:hypothetical protein